MERKEDTRCTELEGTGCSREEFRGCTKALVCMHMTRVLVTVTVVPGWLPWPLLQLPSFSTLTLASAGTAFPNWFPKLALPPTHLPTPLFYSDLHLSISFYTPFPSLYFYHVVWVNCCWVLLWFSYRLGMWVRWLPGLRTEPCDPGHRSEVLGDPQHAA